MPLGELGDDAVAQASPSQGRDGGQDEQQRGEGEDQITLTPPRAESIAALLGLFHPVFGLVEGFQRLPKEELVEVITRDDADERFIGGSVHPKAKTLTLLRGDIEAVVAPFSLFSTSGDGTAPDFTGLRLTDYGRTIVLGDYEASAGTILYELDPIYRRRLRKQCRQSERTFGASLIRTYVVPLDNIWSGSAF